MNKNSKLEMIKIFRESPVYARLFLAQLTSQLGSVIGLMAIAFYLLDRFSTQPVYATMTELCYSLPAFLLFFLVGVWSDRLDRRNIIQYCEWIRAGLTVALLLAVQLESVPLMFAILFVRAAVGAFYLPAQNGLVQGVLGKEQYTTAAGLNMMLVSVFAIFGNGIGALCYWWIGVEGAIVVDLLSFLISALLIRSCVIREEVRQPNGKNRIQDLSVKMVIDDLKAGFHYIAGHRLLLTLMSGLLVLGALNGFLAVLPIFLLKYKLAPDTYEGMIALMGITFGGGLMLGSPVASQWVKKFKLYQMFIGSLFVEMLLIASFAVVNNAWAFVVLYGLFAFILPFVNVPFHGWRQRITDPKMMGRVHAWFNPLIKVSHSLALGFVALVFPKWVGVEALFWLVAMLLCLIALYYLVVLPPLAKRQELLEAQQEAQRAQAEASGGAISTR